MTVVGTIRLCIECFTFSQDPTADVTKGIVNTTLVIVSQFFLLLFCPLTTSRASTLAGGCKQRANSWWTSAGNCITGVRKVKKQGSENKFRNLIFQPTKKKTWMFWISFPWLVFLFTFSFPLLIHLLLQPPFVLLPSSSLPPPQGLSGYCCHWSRQAGDSFIEQITGN